MKRYDAPKIRVVRINEKDLIQTSVQYAESGEGVSLSFDEIFS